MRNSNDFVDRARELEALQRWWDQGEAFALVYGRRRVGKTWLAARFAEGRTSILHTGGDRALPQELQLLSVEIERTGLAGNRDLTTRPFVSWDEALDALTNLASSRGQPILLVLDEFPNLLSSEPALESILRAYGERVPRPAPLRILLSGSAVRTMERIQEERAPLYGRFGLRLQIHPFEPHEAALMLAHLDPPTRALVWGLLGGIPLYLSWWDQTASVADNLAELVCTPGARLLGEGQLVLATEGDSLRLSGPLLSAIAAGRTKFNELQDDIRTDPTRTLDRLVELRLVERMVPVTENPARTRRKLYRIADNFLAFWLTIIDRYRAEIERGLGRSILPVLIESLDDHMGGRWEEAFRSHLRRLANAGELGPGVVAIGSFWTEADNQIDAVVLAGRKRVGTWVGEAKWSKTVNAPGLEAALHRKATGLPSVAEDLRLVIGARERVIDPAPTTLVLTAADIFGLPGDAKRRSVPASSRG